MHLLLTSAAELGFAWDGEEKGWVRAALPPPWDDDLFLMPGISVSLHSWLRGRGFRCVEFADVVGSVQLLNSSCLRERERKCC